MEQVEWEKLTPDEKKRQLFYKQKELLDTFLEHKAISREVFAVGALKACTFMANVTEAGLYNMDDVLGI